MAGKQTIVIAGASARAAAFSALRAGLEPFCLDLFADADLRLRCPVIKLDPATYPRNLLTEMRKAPPGPWMYTGGLENHPRLVEAISRERELWGNGHRALKMRSPGFIPATCKLSKLPFVEEQIRQPSQSEVGQWLVKPWASSGGTRIQVWHGEPPPAKGSAYYQRYCPGQNRAAIYFGEGLMGRDARLLGVTEQLVGESWLNAKPFGYCGSIGPIGLPKAEDLDLREFGHVFMRCMNLCGLFGIDFVIGDAPRPVDVNPRYTASVEVLEYTRGLKYFDFHRLAFDRSYGGRANYLVASGQVIGKAILFARESFTFPAVGPWLADLDPRRPIEAMPGYADIPDAGSFIQRGWPVLTFFAKGTTVEEVRENLKGIAADLTRRFWS